MYAVFVAVEGDVDLMSGREHPPAARTLEPDGAFDLARTCAPVHWARGRWPNVDWRDDTLYWLGWEGERVVWRSVLQHGSGSLTIGGSAGSHRDADWGAQVLSIAADMPVFADPVLAELARKHSGMRPWAAGSLYEGFVSSIVGQSISVAAAAVTERRLYAQFNTARELAGRLYWPPPHREQLAAADPAFVRESGVTLARAEALVAVAACFRDLDVDNGPFQAEALRSRAESLLPIRGVGRWTVESALLWGVGYDDAHPSGDVALLRAARRHWPDIATVKCLDRRAEEWKPHRAWAARFLWLDLLGFPGSGDRP